MSITVLCPRCGGVTSDIPEKMRKKTKVCPHCTTVMSIAECDVDRPPPPPSKAEPPPTPHPKPKPPEERVRIVYVQQPPPPKKTNGCVVALVWMVTIYFYINVMVCFGLAANDPSGVFAGGAVLSGVIAVLFTVLAATISK